MTDATISSRKRVLFVDDEQAILEGIRRSLRPMRHQWEMLFADGGEEALRVMDTAAIDVVVTDMRMPGMDGAQLLSQVRARFPNVIRFVLSGHSDHEALVSSAGAAHQYLYKPCDRAVLQKRLEAALALRDLLQAPAMGAVVSGLSAVPSLPQLFQEITLAVARDASIAEVGQIVARDVGMSAKVLQLVNSPFFGRKQRTADPVDAAVFLGVDTIRALLLMENVFSKADGALVAEFELEDLRQHCCRVSVLARRVARTRGATRSTEDAASVGGLLHEIGRMVLATELPDQYRTVTRRARDENRTIWTIEAELFGVTGATLGAYLLGLWACPWPVVEAVAWHERPNSSKHASSIPLTALHIADALDGGAAGGAPPVELDATYLERNGCGQSLSEWRSLLADTL